MNITLQEFAEIYMNKHEINNNDETYCDSIPKEVRDIIFCDTFNQSVDTLISTISFIKFGYSFDRSVDMLPKLLNLEFGHCFNQSVNMLPSVIDKLYFGHYFNQSVDFLPESVKYLKFGNNFNKSVNMLPKNILTLGIGSKFEQPIDMLPTSTQNLYCYGRVLSKTLYVSKIKYVMLCIVNKIHIIHTHPFLILEMIMYVTKK